MSYQPFPTTSAAPVVPSSPGRRNPVLLILGIVVAVAGIVGGLILLLSASSSAEDSVKNLARAPAGCTTTLDFDSTGRFLVFFERQGTITGLGDDCGGGDRAFGRSDDEVPDQTLTLTGPDGQNVDLAGASGTTYDAGGFAGVQIATVQIDDAGEYELTVAPDDASDTNYAIAIGKDPTANEGTLRLAGIGVIVAGVLVGGALVLLGLRRRGGSPTPVPMPGWPQGGATTTQAWPTAAPAAPPYAGPPTSFGGPATTPSGQPPQPSYGAAWPPATQQLPGTGWSSPAQEEPPRPVPPPDPFSRPPGS
ncbi:MAG: hypothetical protein QM733_22395 [Ilumatobacteraceae bacterium]